MLILFCTEFTFCTFCSFLSINSIKDGRNYCDTAHFFLKSKMCLSAINILDAKKQDVIRSCESECETTCSLANGL